MFGLFTGTAAKVGLLAALTFVTAGSSVAQPLPKVVPGSSTLYIVALADQGRNAEDIKLVCKRAIEKTPGCFGSVEQPRPISENFYAQLSAAISGIDVPTAPIDENAEEPVIARLPDADYPWQFRLPKKSDQELKDLSVTFSDGKKVKYVSGEPTGEDRKLNYILPGRYALQSKKDDAIPVSYDATVETLNAEGKSEAKSYRKEWPVSNQCYMVAIRNFQGDQGSLFRTMKTPEVGNPIRRFEPVTNFAFSFADFRLNDLTPPPPIVGNTYTIRVPRLDPSIATASRVWVKFPMSKEDAETEATEMNAASKSTAQVSRDIRAQQPIRFDRNVPVAIAPVKQGDKTRWNGQWFELLSPNPATDYARSIELADLNALPNNFNDQMYQLVVYEYDDGTPSAVKPGGKSVAVQPVTALTTALRNRVQPPKK